MTVGIVTDSTADIDAEEAREHGVEIVPLTISFGSQSFMDGLELSAREFFERLPAANPPPSTSAPSPGSFLRTFQALAERVDSILCVTISAKLSGTHNAARTARDLFERPDRIEVLDSETATAAEASIVLGAAVAAGHGLTLAEVRGHAVDLVARQDLLVGLETLEFLQRGGRIGRARAFLGGILQVKPLLTLRDGEVAPAERVRSRGRMLERLFQFAVSSGKPESIRIAHADVEGDANQLSARLRAALPHTAISVGWIGPVIGVYTGPGALGLAVVSKAAL